MYDFNLLVSSSRGGYQAARREIGAILRAMGDEGPVVSRTPVRGLVGVRTGLEPRHVVRELRARQEREVGCPQHTCKWVPVEVWVSADVEAMKDMVHRLRDRIGPSETWRLTLHKHRYRLHHQIELVRILAEPVTAKVDLDHPDKILRVDIVGEQAAVSVLAPDEVFSVARSPARH